MEVDQLHFRLRVAPGPVRMPFEREVLERLTRKVDVPPVDLEFLKLALPQGGCVEPGQG